MSGQDKNGDMHHKRRTSSQHYRENNEGGFGNPPVDKQYKKGGPGGPGRPKGSTSLTSALKKAFRGKISLRDGTKVATTDALAQKARALALGGNSITALRFGMELADRYGPPEPATSGEEHDYFLLREVELDLLALLTFISSGTPVTMSTESEDIDPSKMLGTYRVFVRNSGQLGIEKISNYHRFKGEESPTLCDFMGEDMEEDVPEVARKEIE